MSAVLGEQPYKPYPSASFATSPIEVRGWASENYSLGGPPAVVINPDADALTLLSWGLGQLQQCNAILDALSDLCRHGSPGSHLQADFVGQFTAQAETVLRAGVAKLSLEKASRVQST